MDYLVRWVDEDDRYGFSKCDFYAADGRECIGTLFLTASERQLFRDLGATLERVEYVDPFPCYRESNIEE